MLKGTTTKFSCCSILMVLLVAAATEAAPPPAATLPPATVFTAKAVEQSIFNTLTFPARIESRVNALIRCEADGAVSAILKPLGSRVRRGDRVAIIKHTDPVYEYAPLAVVASVGGVISEVHITPGSLVNKGDSIVTVTDPAQLRVMIEVAALDLPSIHPGMKGELSIPGLSQVVTAEVRGLSPSIDPMLGTASCELHIPTAELKNIVAGMVGKIQFKVNPRQGFMLPEHAVFYQGENTFVRVIEDGRAKKIRVKLGDRRHGQVEILSGLKINDEVVARTSRFVSEGEAVQVESVRE